MCVSQFTVLLMRLFHAHSRKPASDIYLRDYLIGGVVWVKREVCQSNAGTAKKRFNQTHDSALIAA